MVKRIEVPGEGIIEFPDAMSDSEIESVLSQQFAIPQAQPVTSPQAISPLAPEQQLAAAQPAGVGSPAESALIGFGAGATRLGQGIAQLGRAAKTAALANLAEVGLVSPETALQSAQQELLATREAQRQQEFFQQTPVGQTVAGQVGQFAGEIAPLLPIPAAAGAALPARIATGAALGAPIGAVQFQPEGGDRGLATGIGAGIGAAFPAAGAAISRFAPSLQRIREAEPIFQAGERAEVPVLIPDIAGSGVQKAGALLERVPVVGTAGAREAQREAAQKAAERTVKGAERELSLTQFGGAKGLSRLESIASTSGKRAGEARAILAQIEEAGPDWQEIVKSSGNVTAFRKKLISDKKYDKVAKLAGNSPIEIKSTQEAVNRAISSQEANPLRDQRLIRILTRIRDEVPQNPTYSQLRTLRSNLGKEVRALKKGENTIVGPAGIGDLQAVGNAIESDLSNFARKQGGKLNIAQREANKFFRENVVPFKNKKLGAALSQESDPEKVFNFFIGNTGTQQSNRQLFNALDAKGKAAVRFGLANEALKESVSEQAGKVVFSPAKFSTAINKKKNALNIFFSKGAKEEMQGLSRLMRAVQRSGQVLENPANGIRLLDGLLSFGAGAGAIVAPGAVAKAGIAAAGLKTLWTNPKAIKIIRRLANVPPNAKKTISKSVDELVNIIEKGAITQTGE